MANAKKRVSAVAALALVAGLFTATPAFASHDEPFGVSVSYSSDYDYNDDTDMYEWVATQLAGANNYVELSGEDYSADVVYLTVTGGTIVNKIDRDAVGTLSAGNTVLTYASGSLDDGSNESKVWIGTPTVGTITVKTYARDWVDGVATDTQLQKFTITVIDGTKLNVPVASKTELEAYPYTGPETTTDLVMPATVSGNYSYFYVRTSDAYDNVTNKKVTATLAGPGNLWAYNAGNQNGKSVTSELDGSGWAYFEVYSDGVAGLATITFTAGGVTVGSWKVNFYGTVANITATNKIPHVVDDWYTEDVIELVVTDSLGNPVPDVTPSVTFDTTKFDDVYVQAATDSKGKAYVAVDPKAGTFGPFEFTFTSNSKTAKASATVTDEVAADIAWAFDKATYAPGEKATVTITVKDKNGLLLGLYEDFDLFDAGSEGLATSSSVNKVLAAYGDVDIAAGKATLTFFMPLGTGDFTISGTLDDDSDIASALRGKAVSISAKVVNAEFDALKAEQAKAAAAIAAVQTTITAIQTAISTLVASFTSTLTLLQTKINRIMKKLGIK